MIGYYNVLQDLNEKDHFCSFKAGDLVLVVSTRDEDDDTESYKIEVPRDGYTSSVTFNEDEFSQLFMLNPNGAEERQREIAQLMQGLMDLNMESINPHIGQSGALNLGGEVQDVGTELLVQNGTMSASKHAMAMVRNKVARTQIELKKKNELLQLRINEQALIMKARASELGKIMKKAEEAIWSINLYLGKNEDIIQIKSGEPAPVDTQISIRQKVLFMDEECALFADEGGITARNADEFDKWILADQKNLDQVLPEEKGILAVKIKRFDDSDYREWDAWAAANAKDANLRWTYFLIRNGENLYRVYVDFIVGSDLFPTRSEYDDLFKDRRTGEILKPGDCEYMKAIKASENLQKHYMRVVLILQGLIDRTPIFQPMPLDRINLCNQNECEAFVRFIYDNEKILGDGRPPFHSWLKDVNSNLQIGHRIVGNFGYRARLHGTTEGRTTYDVRLYPVNAESPKSMVLYTIEDSEKTHRNEEALIFRYERGAIFDRQNWGYKQAETRARCIIYRSDDFVIDFDSVNPEDCKYYCTSRLHRKEYKDMLPLMELVIALKEQEVREEVPFRQLLIGEIMKTGESVESATDSVDELIKWWKFKNRTHRALTSDDQKAIEMIVAEFKFRKAQTAIRQEIDDLHAHVITAVTSLVAPIMIAHKKDNQYVVYVAHNDENIWVQEQLWTINRQTLAVRQKETKLWKLVDKRFERWEIVYKTDRWNNWTINPMMSDVLTDPEIEQLCEHYIQALDEYNKELLIKIAAEKAEEVETEEEDDDDDGGKPWWAWRHQKEPDMPFIPLRIFRQGFKVFISLAKMNADVPNLVYTGGYPKDGDHYVNELTWKRSIGGIKYLSTVNSFNYHKFDYNYRNSKSDTSYKVRTWQDNIDAYSAQCRAVKAAIKKRSACEYKYRYVIAELETLNIEQQRLALWSEFVAEHGDPELFDDHLARAKLTSRLDPKDLERAFIMCAERDIDIVGKTIQEVLDIVEEFGFSKKRKVGANVPRSYVIKAKESEPDDEEVLSSSEDEDCD